MLELEAGEYRLVLDPERGGSVARFDWRGEALMRPTCGPSIVDTACFPLVPFSNRIAHGRFAASGRQVGIAPNMPDSDHPHPLHGFGWLTEWQVVSQDACSAALEHVYPGGEWPWPYRAVQSFSLRPAGLTMTLALQNLAESPMPAGLGFHPYFLRAPGTLYRGLHRGEWQNSDDCLPLALEEKAHPADWWDGQAIGSRAVDTVYTGREGGLRIEWPRRGIALAIEPSENLGFTVVFTPPGAEYFCVEPVSHMTDAVNSSRGDSGLAWLEPSASMIAHMTLRAEEIDGGTKNQMNAAPAL